MCRPHSPLGKQVDLGSGLPAFPPFAHWGALVEHLKRATEDNIRRCSVNECWDPPRRKPPCLFHHRSLPTNPEHLPRNHKFMPWPWADPHNSSLTDLTLIGKMNGFLFVRDVACYEYDWWVTDLNHSTQKKINVIIIDHSDKEQNVTDSNVAASVCKQLKGTGPLHLRSTGTYF